MKALKTIAVITGIGLIVAGIAVKVKKEIDLLKSYCYKVDKYSFKLLSLTKDRIRFNLNVLVKNVSNLNIAIKGYKFDVYLNDIYAATLVSDKEEILKANSVNTLKLDVDVNMKNTLSLNNSLKLVESALLDSKNFIIKIKGSVSAKHSFIMAKNLPIEISMSLYELKQPSENEYNCNI